MARRDNTINQDKLGKILSPAQKIIIFGGLIAAILVLLYSFILMTPFSDLYQIDGHFSFQSIASFTQINLQEIINKYPDAIYVSPITGQKYGIDLAYFTSFTRAEMQVFNHWLFTFGFFGIIASLIPLVYFSQKRKIYYKTNLIVIPVTAGFNLYIGIHMLIQLITNHVSVLSMADGYQIINAYQTHIDDPFATTIVEHYHTTDANPIFIIGYVIAAVVILFAISACLLTLVKYKHQKSQKQVDLSKVVIHE